MNNWLIEFVRTGDWDGERAWMSVGGQMSRPVITVMSVRAWVSMWTRWEEARNERRTRLVSWAWFNHCDKVLLSTTSFILTSIKVSQIDTYNSFIPPRSNPFKSLLSSNSPTNDPFRPSPSKYQTSYPHLFITNISSTNRTDKVKLVCQNGTFPSRTTRKWGFEEKFIGWLLREIRSISPILLKWVAFAELCMYSCCEDVWWAQRADGFAVMLSLYRLVSTSTWFKRCWNLSNIYSNLVP